MHPLGSSTKYSARVKIKNKEGMKYLRINLRNVQNLSKNHYKIPVRGIGQINGVILCF